MAKSVVSIGLDDATKRMLDLMVEKVAGAGKTGVRGAPSRSALIEKLIHDAFREQFPEAT